MRKQTLKLQGQLVQQKSNETFFSSRRLTPKFIDGQKGDPNILIKKLMHTNLEPSEINTAEASEKLGTLLSVQRFNGRAQSRPE